MIYAVKADETSDLVLSCLKVRGGFFKPNQIQLPGIPLGSPSLQEEQHFYFVTEEELKGLSGHFNIVPLNEIQVGKSVVQLTQLEDLEKEVTTEEETDLNKFIQRMKTLVQEGNQVQGVYVADDLLSRRNGRGSLKNHSLSQFLEASSLAIVIFDRTKDSQGPELIKSWREAKEGNPFWLIALEVCEASFESNRVNRNTVYLDKDFVLTNGLEENHYTLIEIDKKSCLAVGCLKSIHELSVCLKEVIHELINRLRFDSGPKQINLVEFVKEVASLLASEGKQALETAVTELEAQKEQLRLLESKMGENESLALGKKIVHLLKGDLETTREISEEELEALNEIEGLEGIKVVGLEEDRDELPSYIGEDTVALVFSFGWKQCKAFKKGKVEFTFWNPPLDIYLIVSEDPDKKKPIYFESKAPILISSSTNLWAHPHCRQHGYPCFGNYEKELNDAIEKKDLISIAYLLCSWLEHANLDDTWGSKASSWPKKRPVDKSTDASVPTNSASIVIVDHTATSPVIPL